MDKENLKKEIHKLVDNIDDEGLLSLVKEDILTYQTKAKENFDDLSDLNSEERKELEELAIEDFHKDTISENEFNQNLATWRKRLSTKKDF